MNMDIIKEMPVYQQWVAEALRDAVRLALEGRFTTLDQSILGALAQAKIETLRDILAHIGTDSLDQVRGRLGVAP